MKSKEKYTVAISLAKNEVFVGWQLKIVIQ